VRWGFCFPLDRAAIQICHFRGKEKPQTAMKIASKIDEKDWMTKFAFIVLIEKLMRIMIGVTNQISVRTIETSEFFPNICISFFEPHITRYIHFIYAGTFSRQMEKFFLPCPRRFPVSPNETLRGYSSMKNQRAIESNENLLFKQQDITGTNGSRPEW
jgi:hypothetical protein